MKRVSLSLLTAVLLCGAAHATAYTSNCGGGACNWNVNASWLPATGFPSSAADTFTISADDVVTIPVSVSIDTGAGSLTAGSVGRTTLQNNGTLTLEGNVSLSGAVAAFNMGAGATLDVKGHNVAATANDIQYVFAGSSGSHCTVQSTGARGAFTTTGAIQVVETFDYCDFSGLANSNFGRSQGAGVSMHINHSTFTGMDDFYLDRQSNNTNIGWDFQYNDIRNPNTAGAKQPGIGGNDEVLGTRARNLSHNTWSSSSTLASVSLVDVVSLTQTDNVMQNAYFDTANGPGGANPDHSIFYNTVGSDQAFALSSALFKGFSNNYAYYEGGNHPFGFILGNTSFDITNNVFEQGKGITGEGTNWFLWSVGAHTWNLKNNVGIGVGFGAFVTATAAMTPTWDISNNTFYADNHNDVQGAGCASQSNQIYFPVGVSTEQTGDLTGGSVKVYNNIGDYDIDLNVTMQDRFVDLQSNATDQINQLSNNDGWPLAPQYGSCVVMSSGKGANDINADPQFVDKTRTLATWDTSLGGPGTAAHAIAEMLKRNGTGGTFNAAYTPAAALTWVRAGFVPTNTALKGAGVSGADIGALAVQAGSHGSLLLLGSGS